MKSKILKFLTLFILVPTMFIFSACSFTNETQGLSAYELAVQNGFDGTVTDWLDSLKGTDGVDGADGLNGQDGLDGEYAGQGLSAYQIAEENGFTGTVTDWLNSLQGEKGDIGSDSVAYAVSKAILSVVSVYCEFTVSNETVTSAGAGVIIEDDKVNGDAYVVTNYHVVYNSKATSKISNGITIYLYGMEYEEYAILATFVGGSLTYDIAVLKIENSELYTNSASHAAELENSNSVYSGDTAIAIGNPEADGISATQGIISVDSEYITMTGADDVTEVTFRVMRIDTAVNSGNSGGGLFNEDGELIGIVNAKTIEDAIENIAYAIPSNIALYAANNIIRNATAENTLILRCMLGVTLEISDTIAHYNTETLRTDIIQTLSINSVDETGVAYGVLQAGDILKSFTYNGVTLNISRLFTMVDYSLNFVQNEIVTVSIQRGTETLSLDITLTNVTVID